MQQQRQQTHSYSFPSESSPHEATILGFPSRTSTTSRLHSNICREIIDLAATVSSFEPVRLYTRPEDIDSATELLRQRTQSDIKKNNATVHEAIRIIPCVTNHCWVRDTGPVYVHRADNGGGRFAIDFSFCEWGEKILEGEDDRPIVDYAAWKEENTRFARQVLELENEEAGPSHVTRVVSKVRLEGGGIELDGQGTFIGAESSIVCEMRNPGLGKEEIERELRRLLDVDKFVWFPGRKALDVTDCHVDAAVRFVRPGVVVVSRPSDSKGNSEWMRVYEEIREVLDRETDAQGRKFEVHVIDEPDPKCLGCTPNEEDPAASYVNFYFVNGGLIVPAFGDPVTDAKAVETLQRIVPDRTIKSVQVNGLPRMGGVLHCVTQQVPRY
ncbi:hypothetical protein EYZ11_009712 [Aspergillus tanneri]|nr:hypothetical protein EYZ11_009712 [Aspergillus tanneri]